jgi:hypothetical protein
MEFDDYHEKEGDEFEEYFKFVRKVAMEDYELCEVAQENMERGFYSQGVLNQVKEGLFCVSCGCSCMRLMFANSVQIDY